MRGTQKTNADKSEQDENALHDAIVDKKALRDWPKQIATVKTLLKRGVSIDTSDGISNTLYIAIRRYYFCLEKDLSIVNLLIEHGARLQKTVGMQLLNDVLAKNDSYQLPMYRSRTDKFSTLINLLLENGAVVNNSNTLSNTFINIEFGGRETCEEILTILLDLMKHGLYLGDTKIAEVIIKEKKILKTDGTFLEYLFFSGIAWLNERYFERLLKAIMQGTDITDPHSPFAWEGCKTHHTIAKFYLQLKQAELVCMAMMQVVRLHQNLKHLSIPNEVMQIIFEKAYQNAERRALGSFVSFVSASARYTPDLTSVKENFLISIFNKNKYIMQQRKVLEASEIDHSDTSSNTLYCAIKYGAKYERIKFILENKADPNLQRESLVKCMLTKKHWGGSDFESVLRMLISYGLDILHPDVVDLDYGNEQTEIFKKIITAQQNLTNNANI